MITINDKVHFNTVCLIVTSAYLNGLHLSQVIEFTKDVCDTLNYPYTVQSDPNIFFAFVTNYQTHTIGVN